MILKAIVNQVYKFIYIDVNVYGQNSDREIF